MVELVTIIMHLCPYLSDLIVLCALLLTFFLVNIGFDLYKIQNNKGGKRLQPKKSNIMDSAIFEEEIMEDDR